MPFRSARLLGVPVDEVSGKDVLQFVRERIERRESAQIVTVNVEFVMQAQGNTAFRAVLDRAELRTADSIGVVIAARRRGLDIPARVGGSDLIWTLSEQAARLGHRVFLLGAADNVARLAAETLGRTYPALQVAGTHSGSPRPDDDEAQIKMLREAKPDILFVAFGAPAQELWIDRIREAVGVPVIMGVGGAFDYVSGRVPRAPTWMQRVGLDWLFRLATQPWRWRRMLALPRFAYLATTRSD